MKIPETAGRADRDVERPAGQLPVAKAGLQNLDGFSRQRGRPAFRPVEKVDVAAFPFGAEQPLISVKLRETAVE